MIEGEPGPELLEELRTAAADSAPNVAAGVSFNALITMYALHASSRPAALRHLRETHRQLAGTELGNIEIWAQALHARNALQMVTSRNRRDAPIREWAAALAQRYAAGGYELFAELQK